ncbi:hypothetical protein QTO34_010318 [Cnephaeus nilssonii]|uniref:Immunoglobulin domain-containing protein n=1 Tax=Cnephaeus nilssonii TaxID=3371016 RepID=A0AA40HG01_CNENI|nr:hypothetical protein QTO34_010318 [Eptesicus nilssonii]
MEESACASQEGQSLCDDLREQTCGGCLDTGDDVNRQENTYMWIQLLMAPKDISPAHGVLGNKGNFLIRMRKENPGSGVASIQRGRTEQAAVTMEFPAASAHRELVPWLGLLLAAFWIPPTTARFAIVTTNVAEGQDVILRTIDTPPDVASYLWYRGLEIKSSNLIGVISWHLSRQVPGPKYTGREIAKLDGTLIIRKVTPRDTGIYTVIAVLPKSRVTGFGRLNVYPPVSEPTLLSRHTTVTENEDAVVMTCYTVAELHQLVIKCYESAAQGEDETVQRSQTLSGERMLGTTSVKCPTPSAPLEEEAQHTGRRDCTSHPVWTEVPGSLTGPRALLSEGGTEQAAVTMEFPEASAHRGLVPWLGLLLAVFLLAFWIPPTTAQFAIVSMKAAEGQDVILRTRNRPPDVAGFIWYRGEKTEYSNFIVSVALHVRRYRTGPKYTGRETANLEGSLIIRKVTPRDTGIYTVIAVLQNSQREIGFGRLNVYPPVSEPTLLSSNTTVTENEDAVVMTCYTVAELHQLVIDCYEYVVQGEDETVQRSQTLSGERMLGTTSVTSPTPSAPLEVCLYSNIPHWIPSLVGPIWTISTMEESPCASQEGQSLCDDCREQTCVGCLDTGDDANRQENTYGLELFLLSQIPDLADILDSPSQVESPQGN